MEVGYVLEPAEAGTLLMQPMNPQMMRAVNEHRFTEGRRARRWERSQPVARDGWLTSSLRRLAAVLRRRPPAHAAQALPTDEPTVEIVIPALEGEVRAGRD